MFAKGHLVELHWAENFTDDISFVHRHVEAGAWHRFMTLHLAELDRPFGWLRSCSAVANLDVEFQSRAKSKNFLSTTCLSGLGNEPLCKINLGY
jgi:hypothetical protein